MADNKAVKSNRDKYTERLKAKYPDRDFADDEALFGQINEDYDDYDNRLATYAKQDETLTNLFAGNPRSAAFLMDWRNGEDPIVGLVRKFGDEFRDALNDPDNIEKLAEANKEYAERVTKDKEYEAEYYKNIGETITALDEMQEEEGLADSDIDDAIAFLMGVMNDAIVGKFSKENIRMALNAINHDGDVALAEQEGEVRGRNTKIKENLRKRSASDGTADLAGKNGGGANTNPMPELGAIGRNYGAQNIWERGGIKRKKYE